MITFLVGAAVSAAGLAMIWPLPDLVADAYLMPVWLCLFCVLLWPLLLSLFGKDFTSHAYLTGILAVGFVAKGLIGPGDLFLNVLGSSGPAR